MKVDTIKKIFHALTVLSSYAAMVPSIPMSGKARIALTALFATISGVLHILTTLYPDLAKAEADSAQ